MSIAYLNIGIDVQGYEKEIKLKLEGSDELFDDLNDFFQSYDKNYKLRVEKTI